MTDRAEYLLNTLKQSYKQTGRTDLTYNFLDSQDELMTNIKQDTLAAAKELEARNLIEIVALASGFIGVELTPAGIDMIDPPPVQPSASAQTINIGTIAGSAIVGNQANATINVGTNLEDISALIAALPQSQQAIGVDLLSELKLLEKSQAPIQKGALSKFSDLLAKHSGLAAAVIGFVGKLIVGS